MHGTYKALDSRMTLLEPKMSHLDNRLTHASDIRSALHLDNIKLTQLETRGQSSNGLGELDMRTHHQNHHTASLAPTSSASMHSSHSRAAAAAAAVSGMAAVASSAADFYGTTSSHHSTYSGGHTTAHASYIKDQDLSILPQPLGLSGHHHSQHHQQLPPFMPSMKSSGWPDNNHQVAHQHHLPTHASNGFGFPFPSMGIDSTGGGGVDGNNGFSRPHHFASTFYPFSDFAHDIKPWMTESFTTYGQPNVKPPLAHRSSHGGAGGSGSAVAAETKRFACHLCTRTVKSKQALDMHIRSHTGEKPYSCIECGKRFSQQASLNRHRKGVHMPKSQECYECGRKFGYRDYLVKHIRIHTGERPYGCMKCEKRFRDKTSLNQHSKWHK